MFSHTDKSGNVTYFDEYGNIIAFFEAEDYKLSDNIITYDQRYYSV
jgi:hypothetical protein